MYRNRNNELEVMSLYRGNYKESRFYLRQISKLSNLPLKTCQTTLAKLENLKVLMSVVEGKNKYFSLNLNNIKTKFYILRAEIYMTEIFIQKYPKIKLFLKSSNHIPLLVFGSHASFLARKNSDLDLLVIAKKHKLHLHLLPFEIHELILTRESFQILVTQKETLIQELEDKHIILNNHSFYVNTMWGYYAK